jgi:predicted alpha/beta superfamily hydrolase
MLTFRVKTPNNDNRHIYLVGTFNNWQVHDEKYKFTPEQDGYFLQINDVSDFPETFEYKYVKGNWEDAELNQFGNEVFNRKANKNQKEIIDFVPRWKSKGNFYNPSFLPEITIIDEHFEIPQLIKTRRIAALLPYNYHKTDKRYPVIYLQDGQNLFDDYAPYGTWGLDKRLALMQEKGMGDVIIVAIDHAREERAIEFTPSEKTKLGIGEGKQYVNFMVKNLKPYVDKHFRTLTDKHNTGIGGSSLGGLISIYAALLYPEVYSRLMIFSPSFWVVPNLPEQFVRKNRDFQGKIYLYGGGKEGSNMVEHITRFYHLIKANRNNDTVDVYLSVNPNGEHREPEWGQEFPKSLEWLFFNN